MNHFCGLYNKLLLKQYKNTTGVGSSRGVSFDALKPTGTFFVGEESMGIGNRDGSNNLRVDTSTFGVIETRIFISKVFAF